MQSGPDEQWKVQLEPTPQLKVQLPDLQARSQLEPSPQKHWPEAHSPVHDGFWPWQFTSQFPSGHLKSQLLAAPQLQWPL